MASFLIHAQVDHGRLGHLLAHPDHRIQGVHGSLRHHGDGSPADVLTELLLVQQHDILAIQVDVAGVLACIAGQQPQDGFGQRALPAA